ncbi:MAG: histidine phosphatase family protein [Bacteroidia bacterium]|nr:histidine phosphatase family protein [Bacteroidia bacterium]
METKKLFIIRHGETDFNRLGVVQGSGVDSPLNETGMLQAQRFYDFYKHVPFDKVYISALQRTKQSVKPFIDNGFAYEMLPELNEISWGIYEGLESSVEWKADYWDKIRAWSHGDYNVCVPGGETPLQLRERQTTALRHIMSKPEEELVLICMHGRAMKSFICLLLQKEPRYMEDFQHTNLCLYEMEYTAGKFELIRENDTEHL